MPETLITGGAGFIGHAVAVHLADAGHRVTIVDDLSRGRRDDDLDALLARPLVTLLEADLCDPAALTRLPQGVDYIYHFAAVIGVRNVTERPDVVLRVNSQSTLNMLEYARAQPSLRRFLFSSTSEAYAGTLKHFGVPIPTPEDVALTLLDVHAPRTTYALSKIFGESACLMYARQHGVPVTAVRYHNVYGPRMGYMHVIPELFDRALREQTLDVASPDHTRAFCYIDDAVAATVRLCELEAAREQVFNVGNGAEEISIEVLARRVLKTLGRTQQVDLRLQPATPGSPARRCPDTRKLIEATGLHPQVDLEEGLRRTWSWYRDRLDERYE